LRSIRVGSLRRGFRSRDARVRSPRTRPRGHVWLRSRRRPVRRRDRADAKVLRAYAFDPEVELSESLAANDPVRTIALWTAAGPSPAVCTWLHAEKSPDSNPSLKTVSAIAAPTPAAPTPVNSATANANARRQDQQRRASSATPPHAEALSSLSSGTRRSSQWSVQYSCVCSLLASSRIPALAGTLRLLVLALWTSGSLASSRTIAPSPGGKEMSSACADFS
jgi:hypothetical protein